MSTPKKELTKIDLYSMGYSPKEIARIKGLTVKEVEDWIRRNGIKTEKDIKQNGWYDRNMVNEVTDEEITKAIQDLPSDEIKELTKEFAYKIIDIVKKSTDWYRYRNEDGLFDNR